MNKRKHIFSPLGASNHSTYKRVENDYYATDPTAIDKLFKNHSFQKDIWECACGEGHLSKKMFNDYNKNVLSTDLIKRSWQFDYVCDFLKCTTPWYGDIITNPPYKHAQEFVEKSISLINNGSKVAMFLKLTFLEGQKRNKMFKKYPPKHILVFSKRVAVARNGELEMFSKSSAVCYAWFVWEKGFSQKPKIEWI